MKSPLAVGGTLAMLAFASVVPANGQAISFELDEHGRLVAVADAFWQITRYARDPAGRLLRLTYPDGRWTEYQYDAQGRMSELRTEKGRELRYRYDPQGLWEEVRFPNGDTQRYATTPDARGLSLTYPDGTGATFRFDTQGRIERAETPLSSLTFRYDANERLDTLLRADGKVVSFRYDGENRVRALMDSAGTERRDWEMTVRTAEAGRILNVTDALDQMEIRRDESGRLTSAASDWGWKAFLHWDTRAGQPRSMTAPWGYVELDSRGQPTEILTVQGGRVTASWDGSGRLERMSIPPLGDLRLRYGESRFPIAIELGDGLRTPLESGTPRLESASLAEASRRRLLERESGIRLQYPMPTLSAEKLFNAQGDRFWSRVASLVEASSKLPAPGTLEALARDDYWISNKYRNDPYYVELARPAPEFSPETFLNAFVLTIGITYIDFAEFYLDKVPIGGKIGKSVTGVLLKQMRSGMMKRLVDPGGDLRQSLNTGKKALDNLSVPFTKIRSLISMRNILLDNTSLAPWVKYKVERPPPIKLVLVIEDVIAKVSVRRAVQLKFMSQGYVVAIDSLGILGDLANGAIRKRANEWLDGLIKKPRDENIEPGKWSAFSLRLHPETLKVVSGINLLARSPQATGSLSDDPRSGVTILRQALEVDLAAIPVNRELEKRGKATVDACPPDQVVCKESPP
ncbi:MAG: hypothetical protein ABUT39_21280 [Acidobacteriota bacterium]